MRLVLPPAGALPAGVTLTIGGHVIDAGTVVPTEGIVTEQQRISYKITGVSAHLDVTC